MSYISADCGSCEECRLLCQCCRTSYASTGSDRLPDSSLTEHLLPQETLDQPDLGLTHQEATIFTATHTPYVLNRFLQLSKRLLQFCAAENHKLSTQSPLYGLSWLRHFTTLQKQKRKGFAGEISTVRWVQIPPAPPKDTPATSGDASTSVF